MTSCYLITPYQDLTSGVGDGGSGSLVDGAAGFCASLPRAPDFCDDFDGPPLDAKWETVHAPASGELRVASDEASSAPHSLRASIPGGQAGDEAAYVGKTFGNASSVTVAFDVRVDSVPLSDATFLVEITLGSNAALLWVAQGVSNLQQTLNASDGGITFPTSHLSWVPRAAWSHVEIVLAVDATKEAVVTIDGAVDHVALDASWTPAPVALRVGFAYVNAPSQERTVHFDNVRVELH